MATVDSLVSRVRLELGDMGKSFVTQFVADGTTNRFKLHYAPLDHTQIQVYILPVGGSNAEVPTSQIHVEESTGVIVLDTVPGDGDEVTVSGTYYRYFTNTELGNLVTDAVLQHSAGHTDSLGRPITVDTLPPVEEYPASIYAVTLALYTLATDASFDIDIAAPDGVSIPRSERYRQLMDMVSARQGQYRDLCVQLGVGMYKIDVFTFRRISKATGRYVPVYKPQEVDDRSYPARVQDSLPTYGDKQVPWITEAGVLTAYQGRSFSTSIDFVGTYNVTTSFAAKLLNQRGSVLVVQPFTLSVVNHDSRTVTEVARTAGQTYATIKAVGHGFAANDEVYIYGINDELNAIWTVASVVDVDHFTITTTATTALALTAQTGVVGPVGDNSYTATLSLTADQTLRIAERTYWSLQLVDPNNTDPNSGTILPDEIKGGNFYTARVSQVVL